MGCGVAELGTGRGLAGLGMGVLKGGPLAGQRRPAGSQRAFFCIGSSGPEPIARGTRSPQVEAASRFGLHRQRREDALQACQYGGEYDC
jgi:hypothetical protein